MNMDPPVSRHRPLGHKWCPASPSWDQLLSKKGKQIYFLMYQEINIVVVELWCMFQTNIYFRISDRAADTNRLSDLQIHVPDTQKPCPEQLGSWQSTAKKKEIFTVVQEETSFSSTIFFFFLFAIIVWRYSLGDEKLQPSKKVKPSDFSLVKIGSWEMLEKCFVEWEQ